MKTRLIIVLFICLSIIQVITPLSMIAKREFVLKNGEQFKFKTVPIDPYDAFRGRYVALRIEENYVTAIKDLRLNNGQMVYALIDVDNQGFAKFTTITTSRPINKPYIQTKIWYFSGDKYYLDLPIDRYYMEEKSAPRAEQIYRQHSQRDKQDAYITVRIKDGFPVIENLFVGGQRIEDAIKQEMKR